MNKDENSVMLAAHLIWNYYRGITATKEDINTPIKEYVEEFKKNLKQFTAHAPNGSSDKKFADVNGYAWRMFFVMTAHDASYDEFKRWLQIEAYLVDQKLNRAEATIRGTNLWHSEYGRTDPHFDPAHYDFYIHGTNTSTLVMMKNTDFKMMSSRKMLEKYLIVPISGENPYYGNNPCFSRLQAGKTYSLRRIIDAYATSEIESTTTSAHLSDVTITDKTKILENITKLDNILYSSAKRLQNGKKIPALEQLRESLNTVIQFLYFLKIITSLNEARRDKINLEQKTKEIIQYVISSGINFKDVYENNKTDTIKEIMIQFGIPDSTKKRIRIMKDADKNINNPLLKIPHETDENPIKFDDYAFIHKNSNALKNTVYHSSTGKNKYKIFIADKITELESKLNILDQLSQKEPKNIYTSMTSLEKQMIKKPFPIVFGFENKNNQRLYSPSAYIEDEYRYAGNDGIGMPGDINIIATDTPKHQALVQLFLKDNGMVNVTVVRFEQMYEWKYFGKPEKTTALSSNLDEYKTIYQYTSQRRKHLSIALAVLGVILPPSLLITAPLWLYRRINEPIRKVIIDDQELEKIHGKRKEYWDAHPAAKEYKTTLDNRVLASPNAQQTNEQNANLDESYQKSKPKKAIIKDKNSGKTTLYVDKYAYERFNVFRKMPVDKILKNIQPAELQESKEKSKKLDVDINKGKFSKK